MWRGPNQPSQRQVSIINIFSSQWAVSDRYYSMIASMKYAMQGAKDFHDGHYTSRARIAIGACQRIMSSWCMSYEVGCLLQYLIFR